MDNECAAFEREAFEKAMRDVGFTDATLGSWNATRQRYAYGFIQDRWEGWQLARYWWHQQGPSDAWRTPGTASPPQSACAALSPP